MSMWLAEVPLSTIGPGVHTQTLNGRVQSDQHQRVRFNVSIVQSIWPLKSMLQNSQRTGKILPSHHIIFPTPWGSPFNSLGARNHKKFTRFNKSYKYQIIQYSQIHFKKTPSKIGIIARKHLEDSKMGLLTRRCRLIHREVGDRPRRNLFVTWFHVAHVMT